MRFTAGEWLIIVGGASMLVLAQLLDWATVDSERGSGGLHNAFDYPATGGVAWVLTVLAGLLTLLLAGGLVRPGRAPWPTIMVAATGIATALMLLRLILGAGDLELPGVTYELGRGAGMWVGLLAAALALAGAVLELRASDRPRAGSPSVLRPPSG